MGKVLSKMQNPFGADVIIRYRAVNRDLLIWTKTWDFHLIWKRLSKRSITWSFGGVQGGVIFFKLAINDF